MATRRKITKETPVSFDFDNITAVPATEPVKTFKHNPLKHLVQEAVDAGYEPRTIGVPVPDDVKKDVIGMLRRAALPADKGGLDVGMTITEKNNGDETWEISFAVKPEKRERKYSVEDVRAWATEQGTPRELIYPRVDATVSRGYRIAHGYPVKEES